jgi:hypothetical protein
MAAGVAAGGLATATCCSAGRGCDGAAGGRTTTVVLPVGATTPAGRAGDAAPEGALATTGPAGGRDAMAGEDGGATTMGGAGRGCGTITRFGSGFATAGALSTRGAEAAGRTGAAGAAGAGAGRAGTCAWRASSSSSFFLARMAFITSPGLETWERSILGLIPSAPRAADPDWDEPRIPRSKCARTFSASYSSSELEWVLPLARPSSARTSRI